MAYQIEQVGGLYVVKENGKIHMSVIPLAKGPPPEKSGCDPGGVDFQYTQEIAAQAIRHVREMLPLGAFNNQMDIDGHWDYLTKDVSPKWLNEQVEFMSMSLATKNEEPRDPVTQMAARRLAALTVGGGVCSSMTYVTAGYLTTIAKPGTNIVAVFDSDFNHEYVVLHYGTSPYVVADPWVGTSYACSWDHCYFPRERVSVHTQMKIGKTLRVPYGVEFTATEVEEAKKFVVDNLGLKPPPNQRFHMDGAYQHPDNIITRYKELYKRVVGPKEWGRGLGADSTKPTIASGKRDVLGWADRVATAFADIFH